MLEPLSTYQTNFRLRLVAKVNNIIILLCLFLFRTAAEGKLGLANKHMNVVGMTVSLSTLPQHLFQQCATSVY